MLKHSDSYIDVCKEIGILTDKKIRKYPLRSANLAVVLKAYAISTHRPYEINLHKVNVLDDYKLYLTDGGLEWLMYTFKQHSLKYLKSVFLFVFTNATEDDIEDETYIGYNNFRGITGDRPKAGTKQKAILMHKHKEFHFETLKEARKELMNLARFYPLDDFKLYRIKKNTKDGITRYYKREVPLIYKESKRGMNNNLPTRR